MHDRYHTLSPYPSRIKCNPSAPSDTSLPTNNPPSDHPRSPPSPPSPMNHSLRREPLVSLPPHTLSLDPTRHHPILHTTIHRPSCWLEGFSGHLLAPTRQRKRESDQDLSSRCERQSRRGCGGSARVAWSASIRVRRGGERVSVVGGSPNRSPPPDRISCRR